jgi:transcriptional regulator with XRE-family HTH domain
VEGEPTAELIRAQLRRLRLNADLSQEEFGKLVHFSGSQVSAVELGQRPLDRLFLKRADEVLGTGGLLTSLLKLAERDGQPSWLRPWLEAERNAQQLRCYHPTLIPGLLQTENYARAVIRADDMLSDDEVEKRLAVRMDRQAVLTRPQPPKLVAVIEESVLRRTDEGFRGLMTQEIAHLVECSEHPRVSVHVIPAEVSVHVGLAGPFTLARGGDGGWVGYLENQLGGSSVDRDEDVAILL